MKCIVNKMFQDGSDWWRIERAQHDGATWTEIVPDGTRHCMSVRLDPRACVEGNAEEMLDLATAIFLRGNRECKRCAVETVSEGVLVWSPRNSNGKKVLIAHSEALELAQDIFRKCGSVQSLKDRAQAWHGEYSASVARRNEIIHRAGKAYEQTGRIPEDVNAALNLSMFDQLKLQLRFSVFLEEADLMPPEDKKAMGLFLRDLLRVKS